MATVRSLAPSAVRYAIVGAALNVAAIGLFAALWAADTALPAGVVSLLASILLFPASFGLNRRWVFRSDAAVGPQLTRFMVVYSGAMAANASLVSVLTAGGDMPAVKAQVISVAIIVSSSFLLNALWTFVGRAVELEEAGSGR